MAHQIRMPNVHISRPVARPSDIMPGHMSPHTRDRYPYEKYLVVERPLKGIVLHKDKATRIFRTQSPQKWLIRGQAIAAARLPLRVSVIVDHLLIGEVTVTECLPVAAGTIVSRDTINSHEIQCWEELDVLLFQRPHVQNPHVYRLRDPSKYTPPRHFERKHGQSSWAIL